MFLTQFFSIVLCFFALVSALPAFCAPLPVKPSTAAPVTAGSDPANDGTLQTLNSSISLISLPGHGPCCITVLLNEKVKATFVVDTGSNFMAVSQSLANKLGLVSHPAVNRDGKPFLMGEKQGSAVSVDSLQFPGAFISGQVPPLGGEYLVLPDNALIFPPDPSHPEQPATQLDGIVGANLLERFAVVFDFPKHALLLFSPGNLSLRQARLLSLGEAGGTTVPISLLPNQPYYDDRFFVPVGLINGTLTQQVSLAIDTGSDITEISRSTAQSLHLKKTGQQRQHGLEGLFNTTGTQVSALILGSLRLKDVQVSYQDKKDPDVVLGMDILSHYLLLLDFPAKTMYLQPIPVKVPP